MGKRAVSDHIKARNRGNAPKPPTPFQNARMEDLYFEIMDDIPAKDWSLRSVQILAAQAAQITMTLEQLQAELEENGSLLLEGSHGPKTHSHLNAINQLSGRLAGIMSRLKVLPQNDAREQQRKSKFEKSVSSETVRGSAGVADWREEARKRGHLK